MTIFAASKVCASILLLYFYVLSVVVVRYARVWPSKSNRRRTGVPRLLARLFVASIMVVVGKAWFVGVGSITRHRIGRFIVLRGIIRDQFIAVGHPWPSGVLNESVPHRVRNASGTGTSRSNRAHGAARGSTF
jgi:hypothetical protein